MDSDEDQADHEPVPLGEAIRMAVAGTHTQASLADELGVRQNTVSRWVTGANVPSLDEIRRIEEACDVPIGFVLRAAGYSGPRHRVAGLAARGTGPRSTVS